MIFDLVNSKGEINLLYRCNLQSGPATSLLVERSSVLHLHTAKKNTWHVNYRKVNAIININLVYTLRVFKNINL